MSPPSDPLAALLRSCSWRAEKIFKARTRFDCVLWLAEYGNGRRETWETLCDNAPSQASDQQILASLAGEMRELFGERGVSRFAVAYMATKVTVSRPVEPTLLMQEQTFRRPVIMFEVHGGSEHWQADREIVQQSRRRAILAALSQPELAADGLYAQLLQPVPALP